jgi:hypothetical protein
MRTFLVFAIIALYIAVAFVPPSTQNLQAAMLQLGDAKLFTGLQVGSLQLQGKNVDLADTAKALGELASRLGNVQQPTFVAGLPGKEYAEKLADAAEVIASVAGKTPDDLKADMRNEFAKQASEAIQGIGRGKPAGSAAWKKMLKAETDPVVLEQLHIIQDAILSGDVRVCGDLPYADPVERVVDGAFRFTPSHGDYLAYCLARVTGESGRCAQIDDRVTPDLRAACGADFGTDV